MRLSVVKYHKNEVVFYNSRIFREKEDIITFPFKEFDKFYNETIQGLNIVRRMIEDSLNPDSTTNPKDDLEHIKDWIDLIQDDMDLLIKFDMQTKLNSFQEYCKSKAPKKATEINVSKEEIQCLMGL
ncbi:MAG: hypothetical protein ACPK7O_06865 [Methanobacterium sp.]